MSKPGHNLVSYQCQSGHELVINECDQLSMSTLTQALHRSLRANGIDQPSMSTRTQTLNRSTPNQWVRSAFNVYIDTSTQSINAKPIGAISYECLHGHKHVTINAKSTGTILNLFIKTVRSLYIN